MADPLLQYLLNGDILGFTIACYTTTMGQGFYALVLLIFFGVLYNRTHSIALCSILWLLLGSSFIATTMIVSPIAIVLVALGLTGIIYSVFGRSG